jgi:hypothetical protein
MRHLKNKSGSKDPLTDLGIRLFIEELGFRELFERDNVDPETGVPIVIANGLPRQGRFTPDTLLQYGQAVIDRWLLNNLTLRLDPRADSPLSWASTMIAGCQALKSVNSISINGYDRYPATRYEEVADLLKAMIKLYSSIPEIKRLHIGGGIFAPEEQDSLTLCIQGARLLKTLTGLWITFHGGEGALDELVNSTDMPALTDLTLCGANFEKRSRQVGRVPGKTVTESLLASGVLPKLTSLRLSDCNITDDELDQILAQTKKLRHLVISKNSEPLDLKRFENRKLPILDELAMPGTEVTHLADFFSQKTARRLRVINFDQWVVKSKERHEREVLEMREFLTRLQARRYPAFSNLRVLNLSSFGEMSEAAYMLHSIPTFSDVRVLCIDRIPDTPTNRMIVTGLIKAKTFRKLNAISAEFVSDGEEYGEHVGDDDAILELQAACNRHSELQLARFFRDRPMKGKSSQRILCGVIASGPSADWFVPDGDYIYTLHG